MDRKILPLVPLAFVLAVSLFAVAACVPDNSLPSYVVMITTSWPSQNRCTGALLDERHVLTVDHCVDDHTRLITQSGKVAFMEPLVRWPLYDLALLRTLEPVRVGNYAAIGDTTYSALAAAYGACPYRFAHTPTWMVPGGMRAVQTLGDGTRSLRLMQKWTTLRRGEGYEESLCGGDSGGVIVYDGQVVGLISGIMPRSPWVAIGETVYAVPGEYIQERLEEVRE